MKTANNKRYNWLLPLIISLLWLFLAVKYTSLPVATGIGFILFASFLLFVPGFAVVSNWKRLNSLKEVALFSFGVGFLIQYVLYFLLAPFHLNKLISYALIAVSTLSVLWIFIKYKKTGRFIYIKDSSFDLFTFSCCTIALFITFVILSMANLEPSLVGPRSYYHDTLNGVGLTVAAYKSFPMESLQMSGWVFPYHLGYYIFTSILMSTLKTTAYVSVLKLSLVLIAPLCVLAFDCLAERCGCNKLIKDIQLFLFVVFPSCTYTHYLYMDTIGFPFGLLLSFMSFLLFYIANDEKKLNGYHLFSSAFLSAAMIAKGPIAVTYLFGICFVLLIELIREKNLWVFPKGLLYAVPCIGLYLLVYGNGAGDSMSLSFFYSAIRTPFSYSIYQKLPDWLFKTLSVLYYSLTMSWTVTIALIIVIAGMFIMKKHNSFFIFSVSSILCGMVLMNIFKQAGSSEVYFLTGVYAICYISAGYVISEFLKDKGMMTKRVLVVVSIALLLALGLPQDIQSSVKMFIGDDATIESHATGFKAARAFSIENYKNGLTPAPDNVNGAIVTPLQYEAYIWLMNNTPEDAVFSDYRYSTNNKYFCASVFSQRSCYLEGWGYLTMEDSNNNTDEKIRRDTIVRFFNDTKQESFSLLLAQEGVEYLIFERVITGDWELSDTYVDEVFRNDDVIIYKIKPVEWH
ncbi:MAG: hypothetical protein IKG47_11070 [Oscillospiraceae bacterium]|nr:hypothetical protein [Oscillospiraceae bacterium]